MISEIQITGFKSLQDFKLAFTKGLNVLIGPNGAGKSNICQALGLIAASTEGKISDYILSLGGGLTAFSNRCSLEGEISNVDEIYVYCKGDTKAVIEDMAVNLRYEYSFTIQVDNKLSIGKEKFNLFKKTKKNRYKLLMKVNRPDAEHVRIEVRHPKEIGPSELGILKRDENNKYTLYQKKPPPNILPLLSILYFACHVVTQDMRLSGAWSIDPIIAKQSSDILDSSDMLPDGRRLANAVHAMIKSDDILMDEINTFLSRILPGSNKIFFSEHPDGTRTFAVMDNRGIPCPANCLSDGTVKVIALLVGMLSHPHSTIIIEEPENYLHPWACQLLIEFFRDHFTDGVCLLTTHSETILNVIKPKELIIIENLNGSKVGNRLSNARDLSGVISASGFGCGYHYIAGSLGGTPE